MADQADTRRMRLMDLLAASEEPQELEHLAATLRCDVRTIRRDLDQLQRVLPIPPPGGLALQMLSAESQ